VLDQKEFEMVTDLGEYTYLLHKGDIDQMPGKNTITRDGRIFLQPQERIMIVFKFLTYREVTLNKDDKPCKSMIHTRRITIKIKRNDADYQTISLLVKPTFTPIDHFFRFYQPEHSDYSVSIPPFQSP